MRSALPPWHPPSPGAKHPLFEMPPVFYPERAKADLQYRPKISEETAKEIIKLYEAGLTQKQVAEKLGVSRVTVKRYLGVRPYNRN